MTAVEPPSLVSFALRSSGPVLFIGLQLSQLGTALKILSDRSVGQLSSAPFLSLFVNCVIWSLYGTITKDMTVLVPNGSGMVVGAVCCMIFHWHHPIPSSSLLMSLMVILIAIFYYAMELPRHIGVMGCLISIVLSASPLTVIHTVLKTQSTSSLPFSVCAQVLHHLIVPFHSNRRAVSSCGSTPYAGCSMVP